MREQKHKDFYIKNAHVSTKKTYAASDPESTLTLSYLQSVLHHF